MRRNLSLLRALFSGLLGLSILGVGGFGVYHVASRHWQVQETFRARADFASIGGLEVGGKVLVQGINAGVVEQIVPPSRPGAPVRLILRLDERLRPLVRSDAVARIQVQGVVGSKVVEISPGQADAPPLLDNGALRTEAPIELADLMRQASDSLQRVNAVADAAEQGLGEITALASAIREGEGTLGRLVQDDEAYDRIVRLTSQGERTIEEMNENLTALKHTWPISRYFNNRAYFDRDQVLYKPGAERESRMLRESQLFEPGKAILTDRGRRHLDELGDWFQTHLSQDSEVVIAAFTDHSQDADLAEVLTQEQADAVRRYLESKHKIHNVNWLRSRKVAAVGFGSQPPRLGASVSAQDLPSRRVEIILFTPQA